MENKKIIEKISKTKIWFFEKISKIDQLPVRPREKERTLISGLKSEMKEGTLPQILWTLKGNREILGKFYACF